MIRVGVFGSGWEWFGGFGVGFLFWGLLRGLQIGTEITNELFM
jgi:hypothetical protein